MADDSALTLLIRAIATGDTAAALRLLAASPSLASAQVEHGATRQESTDYFLVEISHYVYAGDTALHAAAAGNRPEIARALVAAGADVHAKNRRGAQPLHYATDSHPGAANWDPDAQAATITYLIAAGADPNAVDNSGVAPLHRAVRTRGAAAVSALLAGGADAQRPNRNGSTPGKLATQSTGRGGSGTPQAKAEQREIVRLLGLHENHSGRGGT